jgi:ABC-type transport system involved in multi-copper enzyme maturation permease subunit
LNRDTLSAAAGAARYEFRMQVRRRAVWITICAFALTLSIMAHAPWRLPEGMPTAQVVANWSMVVQFLLPVAVGVLLADRLPRDRRTRTSELLETLPASPGGRFLGKYLGSTLATLVPLLLLYVAGLGYIAVSRADPAAFPLGLLAFSAINLPGLLFVAAFSLACPAVLWAPLYQVLFVGYWFWGNLIPRGFDIPSLSGTLLTPLGEYMANGFFGIAQTTVRATAWEAVASATLLLGLAAVALLGAHWLLRPRAALQ